MPLPSLTFSAGSAKFEVQPSFLVKFPLGFGGRARENITRANVWVSMFVGDEGDCSFSGFRKCTKEQAMQVPFMPRNVPWRTKAVVSFPGPLGSERM